MVTDAGIVAAGHVERARTMLCEAGIDFTVYDATHGSPTESDIKAAAEFARGVEVEAGATPVNGPTLRAAYAYTEAEDRSTGTANFGNELARRPSNAATLSFDWAPLPDRVGVPVIGGDLRIVGEAFDNAANTVVLDGYTVFDLRVSMPLGTIAGERPVEIFARAENLFDEEYQTAAGYAQAPRGIFAGLRVGL